MTARERLAANRAAKRKTQYAKTGATQKVITALEANPLPMTAFDLSLVTGVEMKKVRAVISQLTATKRVRIPKRGWCELRKESVI